MTEIEIRKSGSGYIIVRTKGTAGGGDADSDQATHRAYPTMYWTGQGFSESSSEAKQYNSEAAATVEMAIAKSP